MTSPKALEMTSQLPWWLSSSLRRGALYPSGVPFDNVAMLSCNSSSLHGYSDGNKETLCDQEVDMRELTTRKPLPGP
jgi:hypothetical protein